MTASPWTAVGPAGDRLAQARALRRVHEAFHAGQDVGSAVRAVVAQSWERSGRAGVDSQGHLAPIVMGEAEIDHRWSEHPLFPVLPVLRDLLSAATSEAGHMLVISDARGVLLWMEGHHRVIDATHDMHFVCGADWSEAGAGTNALGTAIAIDHPVQIFSAEHHNRIVHPWQCSGAPIHDPVSGEILGVIDLTGHLRTAHPHTLSLVTAAAGMAETYLRHEQLRRDEGCRAAYLERIAGVSQPTALVRPSGEVIMAVPHGWTDGVGAVTTPGGELHLPDGGLADVERLPGDEAYVLWRRPVGATAPAAPVAARLELFGRPARIVLPDGTAVKLSARHAEILAVLHLADGGLTSRELADAVYGGQGRLGTLRAEMSRLRRAVGRLLLTRPYRFAGPVTSDLDEVLALLADDRVSDARRLARAPWLMDSVVPAIVAARAPVETALR